MTSVSDDAQNAVPDDGQNTDCMSVFAELPEYDVAEHVDNLAPNCRCELTNVSPYSTDHVEDDETLIRLIIDPIHTTVKNGVTHIRESFLEDAIRGGASCLRLGRASKDEFQRTVDLLIKGKTKPTGEPREVIGFVRIPAEIARAIRFPRSKKPLPKPPAEVPEFRGFAVYATGEGDRPNHCDVMMCNHQEFSNSSKTRYAADLGKQVEFESITSINDVLDLGIA